MKKQRIEQLTNEMIKILIIDLQEENVTQDSQTIKFKHYNNEMVETAFAAARPKYILEWPSYIIRDEVYATVYESMDIISKNLKLEEISLLNPAFTGAVYNMTMLKLKSRLTNRTKETKKGLIEMNEIAASQLGINEDGQALTIEDILAGSDIFVLMGSRKEKMNYFLKWFNNNKSKILTKKQISFIDGGHIAEDRINAYKMRKRIADRVSNAYQEQYNDAAPRLANLMDQERIITEILESKNFRTAYDKYKEEGFIIDAITEYVDLEHLKTFNKGNNNPNIIKSMRIALYKKLGDIIKMIPENK